MPTITTTNIVIGAAYLYTAAGDTAQPSAAPGPAGATPSGWTYTGATGEGWTLSNEVETNPHYVEEQSMQVLTTAGNATFTISGALAEATLANIKLAIGAGSIASNTLTLSDTLDVVALYFDAVAPGTNGRRTYYIPRANSTGGLEVAMRRSESIQTYNVTFSSACAMSEILITNKTAA